MQHKQAMFFYKHGFEKQKNTIMKCYFFIIKSLAWFQCSIFSYCGCYFSSNKSLAYSYNPHNSNYNLYYNLMYKVKLYKFNDIRKLD